jgi:hypothetical protein
MSREYEEFEHRPGLNQYGLKLHVTGCFEVHHHHHDHSGVAGMSEVLELLRGLKSQLGVVMANIEEANVAIARIDATTTKIAETQLANADVLQEVSDDLDAVIAELGNTVPQPLLERLQAAADAAQAVSDASDSQAAILKGIGAKWPNGPVVPPDPIAPPVMFSRRY